MADNSFTLASFSFDGTCKCSRGGDTTLKFSDDSSLTTHAALLKMASPVFNRILTNCAETKTLVMEKTSRTTWVHILNHLHPAGSLVFSNFDRVNGLTAELQQKSRAYEMEAKCDALSDILEQAKKFKLDSLFAFMDDLLFSLFPKELDSNLAQRLANNNRSHGRLYNLALRFESKLPKTSEKVRGNIIKYLQNTGECRSCGARRIQSSSYHQRVRIIIYSSRFRMFCLESVQ